MYSACRKQLKVMYKSFINEENRRTLFFFKRDNSIIYLKIWKLYKTSRNPLYWFLYLIRISISTHRHVSFYIPRRFYHSHTKLYASAISRVSCEFGLTSRSNASAILAPAWEKRAISHVGSLACMYTDVASSYFATASALCLFTPARLNGVTRTIVFFNNYAAHRYTISFLRNKLARQFLPKDTHYVCILCLHLIKN